MNVRHQTGCESVSQTNLRPEKSKRGMKSNGGLVDTANACDHAATVLGFSMRDPTKGKASGVTVFD